MKPWCATLKVSWARSSRKCILDSNCPRSRIPADPSYLTCCCVVSRFSQEAVNTPDVKYILSVQFVGRCAWSKEHREVSAAKRAGAASDQREARAKAAGVKGERHLRQGGFFARTHAQWSESATFPILIGVGFETVDIH